jgi:hypothetical protein
MPTRLRRRRSPLAWFPTGRQLSPLEVSQLQRTSSAEHIEDRMGDEAVAFIEQHKDNRSIQH